MSKYERRIFFDRLVALRSVYAETDHRPTTMTVAEAIAYATDLLADPDRLDAAVADGPSDRPSEMPSA